MLLPRPDLRLCALLFGYLGLGGLYATTIPLWTAPDEIAHYLYVEYVRDHGESPPRIPRPNRLSRASKRSGAISARARSRRSSTG